MINSCVSASDPLCGEEDQGRAALVQASEGSMNLNAWAIGCLVLSGEPSAPASLPGVLMGRDLWTSN